MLRNNWWCQFLEPDLKTPLRKTFVFTTQDKIIELAERGGCVLDLEARQAIAHAFEIGRGGVWLNLTEEQYERLTRR